MNPTTTHAAARRTLIMSLTVALAVASLPARALATVAATTGRDGRTLTIRGDAQADALGVSFDAEADTIDVWDESVRLGSFAAGTIEKIRILLGGGDDTLAVLLAAEGHLASLREVSVALGSGDDTASIELNSGVGLQVSGGAGHDVVSGSSSDRPSPAFRSVESRGAAAAIAPALAVRNGLGEVGECTVTDSNGLKIPGSWHDGLCCEWGDLTKCHKVDLVGKMGGIAIAR